MRLNRLARGVMVAWLAMCAMPERAFAQATETMRWYKGNTHTHTINSDGDATPDDVVRWYREHHYDFLVLTDHNFLTSIDGLNALHGADEKFVVIKGEEITDQFEKKPLHINGLDVGVVVQPQGGASVLDTVQRDVDAIRKANGIPSINHPNYGWAISGDELGQLRNTRLFEVFNGHPLVNNLGGGDRPGLEQVWDTILSRGTLLYGIAVDDAHTFKDLGNPKVANPGRGWVVVRAPRLDGRSIVEAMERGQFYASTGVELSALEVSDRRMSVAIKAWSDERYRIQFIGKEGRLLREENGLSAVYEMRGDEGYVRARVIESNGRMAWCQPIIVPSKPSAAGVPGMLVALLATGMAGAWRWRTLHGVR